MDSKSFSTFFENSFKIILLNINILYILPIIFIVKSLLFSEFFIVKIIKNQCYETISTGFNIIRVFFLILPPEV